MRGDGECVLVVLCGAFHCCAQQCFLAIAAACSTTVNNSRGGPRGGRFSCCCGGKVIAARQFRLCRKVVLARTSSLLANFAHVAKLFWREGFHKRHLTKEQI